MIPKKIHLCWFSGEPFPVEIKECLASWMRLMPDYEIRLWTARDARAIHCQYVDEALDARKWAFAADAVRWYAVWSEGGVYMDSDILLFSRFDHYLPDHGFVSVHEVKGPDTVRPQAAFFAGDKGNEFCRMMYDYYAYRRFRQRDGSLDQTEAHAVMHAMARGKGYRDTDCTQILDTGAVILPGHLLTPDRKSAPHPEAFGRHTVYGSWHDRSFGRRVELRLKHWWHLLRYHIRHLSNPIQLPPSR